MVLCGGRQVGARFKLIDLLPEGAVEGRGVSGLVLNRLSGGMIDKHSRTPMECLGEPEEIVNAIAFFASDEASSTTKQILPVDAARSPIECRQWWLLVCRDIRRQPLGHLDLS